MKKMTRMECSKEVRRVLNRNGVDLSYCQYSVAGYEIRLTGWLCKTDGTEFIAPQIEGMIFDFKKALQGFMVFGDFENWNFTSEFISYVGEKDAEHQGAGFEDQTVYEIDLEDFDFEAS